MFDEKLEAIKQDPTLRPEEKQALINIIQSYTIKKKIIKIMEEKKDISDFIQ